MKKTKKMLVLKIFVFVILLSLFLPGIDAHFVCGKVNDSDDGMSASWFNVNGFYENGNKTSCEVSPDENKYCCDFVSEGDYSWTVGDVVSLEIFDKDFGYFAGPVSVKTTGEGYDVAPEMKLKKTIKLHSPENRIVFEENRSFLFNASFSYPYNNFSVYLNNESVLNETENKTSKHMNCSIGKNVLEINASHIRDKEKEFYEKREFYFLGFDDYNFSREISCKGCSNNRVRGGQTVNVSLDLKLNVNISGGELREYVPIDWNNISIKNSSENSGKIRRYNENYSVIVWNVSGKNITKEYSVKSPGRDFRPRKYSFVSVFGNRIVDKSEISVRGYFPSFLKNRKRKNSEKKRNSGIHEDHEDFVPSSSPDDEKQTKSFNKLSKSNPAVIENKSRRKNYKIAVFPKNNSKRVSLGIFNYPPREKIKGGIYYYTLGGDISEKDIKKIFLDIEINKSELKDKDSGRLDLYMFRNNSWEKSDLNYSLERDNIRYRGYEKPAKSFAIVEDTRKNKDFRKVFSFFGKFLGFLKKPLFPVKFWDITK